MFRVNSKGNRTKPIDAVAVSYDVNQTQKQPPDLFYKKSCSQRFNNILRKKPVYESLLNKVAEFPACSYIKKRLQHRHFPVKYCEIFKNTYFEKHLPTAAFVDCKNVYRTTESQIEMKYK